MESAGLSRHGRRLLAEKLREVDPERTRNCLLARELNDAEAAPPAALVERHLPTAQEYGAVARWG